MIRVIILYGEPQESYLIDINFSRKYYFLIAMNRYFIYIAFNGKNYCGWQIQPNKDTVQQKIQQCLSILLHKSITITGAGRTDTGVHANLMTAHFDWEEILSVAILTEQLNKILPYDILIYKIVPVKADAHARFDAVSRTYKYYISYQKDPFRHEQLCKLKQPLNKNLMNEASKMLLTYSDFTSFCKLHSNTRNNICQISKAEWNTIQNIDIFTIRANRFIRNMVRFIVGIMIDIGKNKISVAEFKNIIESKNRALVKTSAPAHALFLTDIEYPDRIFKNSKFPNEK